MTDHSSHNHPATPAARAKCRRTMSQLPTGLRTSTAVVFSSESADARRLRESTPTRVTMARLLKAYPDTRPRCAVATDHCQLCGSTSYEDLTTGDQGYTACCNEPIESAHCDRGELHHR